jgi:type IV secretion system protein VirB6
MTRRDLVGDALRVAIVLTLATSWPAWRTLGYDLVMRGPGDVAAAISNASGVSGDQGNLVARLQAADDGIVLLTVQGTGRNTGGNNRSDTIGDSFRGIALADQEGLANGRIAFLAGVIGPLGIVRLGAGLLLALAPLMAGLLLFAGTRDLFFGWLRGLGMLAMGSLVLAVVFGVELSILEPWLRDALAQRDAMFLTPSAPTELFVITLAFALVSFGLLALLVRIFFFGGLGLPRLLAQLQSAGAPRLASGLHQTANAPYREAPSRAFLVAEAVAQTVRREEGGNTPGRSRQLSIALQGTATAAGQANVDSQLNRPLGSSYRQSDARRVRRASAAGIKRDARK